MRIKKLFAGVLAGAMVVGCMAMPAGAAASTYSASDSTIIELTSGSSGWFEEEVEMETLFPAVAYVADVESATFTFAAGSGSWWLTSMQVAYNAVSTGAWYTFSDGETTCTMTASDIADISDTFKLGASSNVEPSVTVDYTYTAYDDVIMIPVSDTSASSYTVTLTSTSGRTCEVTGTEYVKSGDSKYIEIDVSAIPESETITYEVIYN